MDFEWPDGQIGAISLTFDDGLPSQLRSAIPILDEAGLRGTFYVNPNERFMAESAGWVKAAQSGHELGNHTMGHPCSKNFAFIAESGRQALEEMAWADMDAEIRGAGERLAELLPEQGRVSFGYPCYQPFIGRGATRQSYVPLVLEYCVAGRGRGERANDPHYCELGYLWSFPCERMSGAEMIGLVEQVIREKRWGILTFHGIHEGHLSVSEGDLAELCAHLNAKREQVWTGPVCEVAAWVGPRQAW